MYTTTLHNTIRYIRTGTGARVGIIQTKNKNIHTQIYIIIIRFSSYE
ncbi:MAG: hypothetical protein ACI90V_008390 [Bacillariaceae sp.]|jgi:hypothetical protein